MALHSGRHFSAGERKFDQVISINGSRPNQNMFLRDGGINSEPAFTGPGYFPSVDLVDQYKVQTSNFSAEFSHTGGGLVNVITKSGGNTLHGSAWEFFRNTNLVANDVFSNRAGLPRAQFRFNQFGGTAGGPIRRDKTFFFASYEGLRWVQSGSAVGQFDRCRKPIAAAISAIHGREDGQRFLLWRVFVQRDAAESGEAVLSRVQSAAGIYVVEPDG